MKSELSRGKMEAWRWNRVKKDVCTGRPRRILRAQEPMPEHLVRPKSLREKGLEFNASTQGFGIRLSGICPSVFP